MHRIFHFSKPTFLAMPLTQQHKKCAEVLREIYVTKNREELKEEYGKLCSWMGLAYIDFDIESVEQRFYEHMGHAGRSLSEHDFLSNLVVGDGVKASKWLGAHTYLDGLRSCHNVGSIIRTVEAFRLGPIHLSADMMMADHRQVQKTSMGAVQYVTATHGTPIEQLPRPWIALETVRAAPAYNEWLYSSPCTIIVGNEVRGIRASLLQQVDMVVTIPLHGMKNSLNVANAFAIIASEIASQRRIQEGSV